MVGRLSDLKFAVIAEASAAAKSRCSSPLMAYRYLTGKTFENQIEKGVLKMEATVSQPSEIRTLGSELNELISQKSSHEAELRKINKSIEQKRKEFTTALQKGENGR